MQSTLGIVFQCGEFAAIPSLVRSDDLVAANGRIMATNSAGNVVGPILAGALVAFISVSNLLFFDAFSFLVSAGALAIIQKTFDAAPRPGAEDPDQRPGIFDDVKEGLRFVWSHPVLRSISIMMALINFASATENSQLVLFAKDVLHATNTQTALLFAAGAAGVVIVGLCAASLRRHLSFAVCALGALVISGLAVTAMAIVGPLSTGPAAVGGGLGLRPPAQHQHRIAAPGHRPEPPLRTGDQRGLGAGLVGHPARCAGRSGRHPPHRKRGRRLRRQWGPHRPDRRGLRLQPHPAR